MFTDVNALGDTALRASERSDDRSPTINARRALRRVHIKAQQLSAGGGGPGRRRGRLHRAVNDLTELLVATGKIAAHTRQRVAGVTPTITGQHQRTN